MADTTHSIPLAKIVSYEGTYTLQVFWYTLRLFKYHTYDARYMVTAEDGKKFHKKKAVDALDRMKKAVDKEDLKDANRQEDTADHHLDEMARLKSDEEEVRVTGTGTPE